MWWLVGWDLQVELLYLIAWLSIKLNIKEKDTVSLVAVRVIQRRQYDKCLT